MNKSAKIFAAVLSVMMAATISVGCKPKTSTSVEPSSNTNTGSSLPIVKDKITLKYFYGFGTNISKYIKDMNENHIFIEMEKRTNIHISFVHPPAGQ